MRRWEYLRKQPTFILAFDAEMDELGQDGWELVSIVWVGDSLYYYFKRPLGEDEDE